MASGAIPRLGSRGIASNSKRSASRAETMDSVTASEFEGFASQTEPMGSVSLAAKALIYRPGEAM